MNQNIENFFSFARERHRIYLKRSRGEPAPWTNDPILRDYSFTNVFRELDKTTVWIRENVRAHTFHYNALYAMTLARWFNRIETLELIKEELIHPSPVSNWPALRERIRTKLEGVSPVVTGAYMVKTPSGTDKQNGILWCMDQLIERYDFIIPKTPFNNLHRTWTNLIELPFLGGFMAYEIVTDLRWCGVLNNEDILTWANPGPGCTHGLGLIYHGDKGYWNRGVISDREEMIAHMQELLEIANTSSNHWPTDWPKWELRDVEHTLCEFYKYERARTGGRMPKGKRK